MADKKQLTDFFKKLSDMKCISPIWEKVLDVLTGLEPSASFEALAVFCIYFSQIDDGNICIPVTQGNLIDKWQKKWEGLLLQEHKLSQKEDDAKYFSDIIDKGLPQISQENLPNLIAKNEDDDSKPFIIDKGWLFATKYFKAKINIEDRIQKIMKRNTIKPLEEEKAEIREYFKNLTASEDSEPMTLEDEQLNALLRGLDDNLIITGGPGTGKTTVICYLLWRLFLTRDVMAYSLYLAAPSGKAADRMKESLSKELEKLHLEAIPEGPERDAAKAVFDKLNSAQSSTIHRLLSFNPSTNGFRYNKDNKFDKKSIFVIDEASMIDITLFSSLLDAIKDGSKVFILGDKDQLPSVQAGAVLGELLAKKTSSVADLKKSRRFNDNSDIGRLKNAMQDEVPLDRNLAFLTSWDDWKSDTKNDFKNIPDKKYPVTTFIPEKKYDDRKKQFEEIVTAWGKAFYEGLVQQARNASKDFELSTLDTLWDEATKARILCAERKGIQGVETINEQICSQILKKENLPPEVEYFTGQLLMLTKNQSIFCLYNGDSGIVVECNGLKYLMVKKEIKNTGNTDVTQQGIFQKGSYMFYPLHLLPKESIETAYAITIHKSQGSDYKAIFVTLPSTKGHPLLNRQITYTAITRTKGATYIFADYDTLEHARQTVIERDTQIHLD